MPPKKKPGKSKKKGKKEVDPEEKLRQDLLLKALSLQGENDNETSLEAQLSKQSGLLRKYWEIEKKTRDERSRDLLAKEHRSKEIGDGHVIDLNRSKLVVKRLLFSNQDELSEKTIESFMEHQSLLDRHKDETGQLHGELRGITNRIREKAASHDKYRISIQHGCSDGATSLRERASCRIASLASYSEKQYKRTREEAERRAMEDVKGAEARNEEEIGKLMDGNRDEIRWMRSKYGNAMNENLDGIAALRREAVLLREQDRLDRLALGELRSRNDGIVVPLETNRKSLHNLEGDLIAFHRQKRALDARKQKLRCAEGELKEIEWNHEVLYQKLEALEADRDRWKEESRRSVRCAQQRANFDNLLLERKLRRSSMTGDQSRASMARILQKANVDLETLDQSKVRVTDVLKEKNEEAAALRQRLDRIKDAHKVMVERHRKLMETAKEKANAKASA